MEEIKNLTQDDVLELITDFPITPRKNKLIITVNTDTEEEDDLNLSGSTFAAEQFVLAAGSYASDISAGQKIHLDLEAMMVKVDIGEDVYNPVTQVAIEPVKIGDKVYGMITDDKVDYLINI